jgi:ubiquinone/menaquinone biosynthesis C-methylase UbiE
MKQQDFNSRNPRKTPSKFRGEVKPSTPFKKRAVSTSPFIKRDDTSSAPLKSRVSKPYEHKAVPVTSSKPKTTPDTSWGGVADWYNKHLENGDDTYHSKIIFPNILRMLGDVTHTKILDMACGQGIFSEKLRDEGALVTGVDLGKQLIKIAEEKSLSVKQKGTHKVTYHVSSSDDMYMLKDASFDVVVCILALQNIENLQKTMLEASRVLTKEGKLFFVLNHPSFRNPRKTFWGYNEADDTQYRRVDEYMSESNVKIDMTPGSAQDKKFTVSFHRPLQVYMKSLSKAGFAITRLEEWVSHKESERGPKKRAEDKSRKEIPMFMCVEAKKLNL